ncbi:MAG: hypothetical protein IPK07_10730 [Deltaproteobacteria bacterium]|nr:hypothetical protein [Deltaproteobacteria bacterium]
MQGLEPSCIDWAAMPAIAGDHSCSSKDMLDTVTGSEWILAVADVAAQLKLDLAQIPVVPQADAAGDETGAASLIPDLRRRMQSESLRAKRLNALRTSDLRLQRADPAYATRAGANNAHFLLARPSVDIDQADYAGLAVHAGTELNAVGVYGSFHLSAVQKATRLANEQLSPEDHRALVRSLLADEAFALHFLEDTYAAGHVAGTWGDASQRKGTHDHYNENGLEVFTWGRPGRSVVLMGDAHMRPEDAELAARAVRTSLEQLVDAAEGRAPTGVPYTPAAPAEPDAFDVCKGTAFSKRPEGLRVTAEAIPLFNQVLQSTPVPGLGAGLGSVPRFRAELGPFIGLGGLIDARYVDGGFESTQQSGGMTAGLDLSLRAGVGLDGVIGESGDGLVFAAVGLRADTASSNKFSSSKLANQGGSISAAIPARTGLAMRLRAPFYLVPGDVLLLAPLYLLAPDAYTSMAVTASNGGLLPWQVGWATPIGRFQFVAGRELGVTLYGIGSSDQLIAPAATAGSPPRLVDFESISFDLPIGEYRPYRSFAGNQSSTVLFQLTAGADVPSSHSVVSPPVDLGIVWSVGLRMIFDWRYYQ